MAANDSVRVEFESARQSGVSSGRLGSREPDDPLITNCPDPHTQGNQGDLSVCEVNKAA